MRIKFNIISTTSILPNKGISYTPHFSIICIFLNIIMGRY